MMKRIFCSLASVCLLCTALVFTLPVSADAPNTPDAEFACVYSASAINDYVRYGSTEIVKMTAAEAAANGVPTGYTDNVLQVKNGDKLDRDILLDFSSMQIPVSVLESITFRVWVGDDGKSDGAYPEVRIPQKGTTDWIMRYDVSGKTDQWVDIVLRADGTNFYGKRSFADLASTDGYLDRFALSLRCKAKLVDFYIDSITYTLVKDTEAPELRYEGEDMIYAPEGSKLSLNVSAYDAIQGNLEVDYVWNDSNAINADGTLNRGTYELTLRASDYFQNTATKTLTVVVGDPDTTPPEILLSMDVMHLVTGTRPVLDPQATDNIAVSKILSYWSPDALDVYGCLTGGIHLYTVKAFDHSGNEAKKTVIVYVTDDEQLGDNVIDEANPPISGGDTTPPVGPDTPSSPTPEPLPSLTLDRVDSDSDASLNLWSFFSGSACGVLLAAVAYLIVQYVKKRRGN